MIPGLVEPLNIDPTRLKTLGRTKAGLAPLDRVVTYKGRPVDLTPLEASLFWLFVDREGEFLTAFDLVPLIWPGNSCDPNDPANRKLVSRGKTPLYRYNYSRLNTLLSALRNKLPGVIQSGGYGRGWCYPGQSPENYEPRDVTPQKTDKNCT